MIKWFSILWEYAFFTNFHPYGTILAHTGLVVNTKIVYIYNRTGRIK